MAAECPTILIADDAKLNRTIMKKCLQEHGYRFLEAENGLRALEHVRAHQVDLVLLDLIMPEMDGFACLTALKADPHSSRIPVIINSSLEDLASIKKALTMGSQDYFFKSLPPDELQFLLPLKVKNAIQTKLLFDQTAAQKRLLEAEIHAASKYQRFLLPKEYIATGIAIHPYCHQYIGIGGDFFDFIPLSGDKTALLIADVCGHGVLAAMVAALLKPLFERSIRATESPLQTLACLNQDFLCLTDSSSYITAFVAVYDPSTQTLCYANAGHPPALYFRRSTKSIEMFKATGVFLGIFDEQEWRGEEKRLPVAPHDRLLLMTDGVIEAMASDGSRFGIERICKVFRELQETTFSTMIDDVWQHLRDFAGGTFQDDVTFIAVAFQDLGISRVISMASDPTLIFPVLEEILAAIGPDCSSHDRQAIKISLVEMLMNAIEHGNLAIGYAHKKAALEAGTFEELIATRCHTEPYASRLVTITYSIAPTQVTFVIRDEGSGFNWDAVPTARDDAHVVGFHGRGILITRASMDQCFFDAQGNAVTLVKYLSPPLQMAQVSVAPPALATFGSTSTIRKDHTMHIATTATDTTTTLTLTGPIDFLSRKTLGNLIEAGLAQGHRDFALDLQGITFIDSSGLGALVACFSTIRKQGGSMKLVQLPSQVRELIEMTKLTDFFDL